MLFSKIYALIGFSAIIFIHELGHYLIARWRGIGVTTFAIGFFGPRLVSFKDKKGTQWVINLIPFGGYIAPKEECDKEVQGSVFENAKPSDGILVAFAGPLFNLISAALLLFFISIKFGKPENTNIVQFVKENSIFINILQPFDTILEINEKKFEHNSLINLNGLMKIKLQRDDKIIFYTVEKTENDNIGLIMQSRFNKINVIESIKFTCSYLLKLIFALINTFKSLNFKSLQGPIGVFKILGSASEVSIAFLLLILVNISVSIAIFNLLPLPSVDGGRILIFLFTMLTNKKVPKKIEAKIDLLGYVLLIFIMLVSSYNDIKGLIPK